VTWKHVAALALTLGVVVACILSPTCAGVGLKEVMPLVLVVAGGIMGNANSSGAVSASATSKGASATEKPSQ